MKAVRGEGDEQRKMKRAHSGAMRGQDVLFSSRTCRREARDFRALGRIEQETIGARLWLMRRAAALAGMRLTLILMAAKNAS